MSAAIYLPADVLWARVLKRVTVQSNGCWIWQGATTSRGYGCIGSGRKSKSITTHRLAVIVRDGAIPEGMTVDHRCHNASDCRAATECLHRRCVNPDHLDVCRIGTNAKRARLRWRQCAKGHALKSVVDEVAGTHTLTCAECGPVRVRELPSWWHRSTA